MASLLTNLLLLGVAVSPARATMAAWWNGIAPQIIVQNDTTNQIRYSPCNAIDEAQYSHTDGRVLSISSMPKPRTPLAGVGWYNDIFTVASIFYIDEDNNIANGFYHCEMSTGLFQSQGNWIVSEDVPSIHPNSGLAAVVIGEVEGYRVYYHDSDGAVNELAFYDMKWRHRGVISNDINSLPALAATFSGAENITVASARDEENIGVTRWNRDKTWFHTTLPQTLNGTYTMADTGRDEIVVNDTAPVNFTLPAWDGKTKAMGISIDRNFTRHLWYIGNDSSLHQVANQNHTWGVRQNQSEDHWPQADEPNADLAVAYDFRTSMVCIYYMVTGKLAEIRYEDRAWKAWSALETPTPLPPPPTPTPSQAQPDSGLSTGAKAGIGVGVSLGAIALGAIIAVLVLARRKKQKQQASLEQQQGSDQYPKDGSTTLGPETPSQGYSMPTPGMDPAAAAAGTGQDPAYYAWDNKDPRSQLPAESQAQQLDSTTRSELYAPQPVHELPSHTVSHELMADMPHPQR